MTTTTDKRFRPTRRTNSSCAPENPSPPVCSVCVSGWLPVYDSVVSGWTAHSGGVDNKWQKCEDNVLAPVSHQSSIDWKQESATAASHPWTSDSVSGKQRGRADSNQLQMVDSLHCCFWTCVCVSEVRPTSQYDNNNAAQ